MAEWVVTRKGEVVYRATDERDAYDWLRRWCLTGQFSMGWAMDHCGYCVERVVVARAKGAA